MLSLNERVAATNKTMAKFRTRHFDWRSRATCIHMARTHLRNMGHRPPPIPDFRSPMAARKALEKSGFDSVTALFDSLLPRIAPAEMWVGDLAVLPGSAGLDSINIWDGIGKFLGWHEDDLSGIKPQLVLTADQITGAWRV